MWWAVLWIQGCGGYLHFQWSCYCVVFVWWAAVWTQDSSGGQHSPDTTVVLCLCGEQFCGPFWASMKSYSLALRFAATSSPYGGLPTERQGLQWASNSGDGQVTAATAPLLFCWCLWNWKTIWYGSSSQSPKRQAAIWMPLVPSKFPTQFLSKSAPAHPHQGTATSMPFVWQELLRKAPTYVTPAQSYWRTPISVLLLPTKLFALIQLISSPTHPFRPTTIQLHCLCYVICAECSLEVSHANTHRQATVQLPCLL